MRSRGDVLQSELIYSPLSLLKHARAAIGGKVELLHHHVFWNADLFPQVQAFNGTNALVSVNKRML